MRVNINELIHTSCREFLQDVSEIIVPLTSDSLHLIELTKIAKRLYPDIKVEVVYWETKMSRFINANLLETADMITVLDNGSLMAQYIQHCLKNGTDMQIIE